ncbi:hypothetical protein METP2_02861 [Methanosarcinales archaeon]|nr:hypothetical protein METP2_02861 [Methanosarcinales archaeon]
MIPWWPRKNISEKVEKKINAGIKNSGSGLL